MGGIVTQNINRQSGLVKAPEAGGGAWNFISKTSGDAATISITSGIDSTYKVYLITCNNIHAATDNQLFLFNGSDDTSSHSYDISKQTTFWRAYHSEGDASGLGYDGGGDLANGTGFQVLNGDGLGIDNDQCTSGYLYLYNPSSTTFLKHFSSVFNNMTPDDYLQNTYVHGYFNTTAAITALQFKMASGNINSGDICLYGLTA